MHHTSTEETSHTHWASNISGEEQLALQQLQTNRHTTILITPQGHTPSLQFTPLLPTTTHTPAPLGRHSVGEMAVMVSLALPVQLAHQDLQGYPVPLVHPA